MSEIFITAASWEPRFIEGAKRVFEPGKFSEIICFLFQEYIDRTLDNKLLFGQLTAPLKPQYVLLPMYSTDGGEGKRRTPAYVTVWHEIRKALIKPEFTSFVLDITTMPRETLWITLDLLTEAGIPGKIIYHRAAAHGDWCGTEPETPHIVPKLGGLPILDRPTKLMIISGYDEDRSEQFIAAYEPRETVILFQDFPTGTNEENRVKNEERHKKRFGTHSKTVSLQGVDFYENDWGFKKTLHAAKEIGAQSNLILASLGPKTSAISLYRVHRNLPESCLIYAPCKNYNPDYSKGIGEMLSIDWQPEQLLVDTVI
jgi:hypothetical protein